MTESVNHSHSFEERLSRLEATVETFVLTVSKDIQEQNGNINALRQAIQEQIKPQYQTWLAALGVVLLIAGMFGTLYMRDTSNINEDLLAIQQDYHDHTSDGHPQIALREMKMYRDVDQERMEELRVEVKELRDWKRLHSSEDEKTHARHAEALRFLEKEMDRQWRMSHPKAMSE